MVLVGWADMTWHEMIRYGKSLSRQWYLLEDKDNHLVYCNKTQHNAIRYNTIRDLQLVQHHLHQFSRYSSDFPYPPRPALWLFYYYSILRNLLISTDYYFFIYFFRFSIFFSSFPLFHDTFFSLVSVVSAIFDKNAFLIFNILLSRFIVLLHCPIS